MAHAYTPGLRVTDDTVIHKRRVLPIPGEILVTQGEIVSAPTVVARTELPGKVHTVNVVNLLSLTPAEVHDYMLKKEGDAVEKDEPIAENRPFIRWFKTQVRSPIKGTIESVSRVTGQVFLREPPEVLELSAYVDGEVVEVTPKQGGVVACRCAFVQGIFGIGGETMGTLALAVESPEEVLSPDRLRAEHRGQIVVGGSLVEKETFVRAREVGVQALVVGGVYDKDLKELLGYDLGVAITGTEKVGFALIISEGFGKIPMARRTFDLLAAKAGCRASCSGATQIRAGVIRPEVIIPLGDREALRRGDTARGRHGDYPRVSASPRPRVSGGEGLKVGALVRLIREPYFGVIARVKELPPELQVIPTESKARVLVAELPDGQIVTVPRANVEMIEE